MLLNIPPYPNQVISCFKYLFLISAKQDMRADGTPKLGVGSVSVVWHIFSVATIHLLQVEFPLPSLIDGPIRMPRTKHVITANFSLLFDALYPASLL